MKRKKAKIKNLAKGKKRRLLYYELRDLNLARGLRATTRFSAVLGGIFFRAEKMDRDIRLVRDNVKSIEGGYVGNTPLIEIPVPTGKKMGKKRKFIVGNRMVFWGVITGVVYIIGSDRKYRCLEIKIVHRKLYFYSYINKHSCCEFLKLAS